MPLFLVSRNLTLSIDKKRDTSRSELSGAEQRRLKSEIEKIINNNRLSDELKEAALILLSSKYRNDSFLNIVEEIEQNLFPSSQKDILFTLFEYTNHYEGNSLILTTHSPYIINFLSLAAHAGTLLQKIKQASREELLPRLNEIVPEKSCVNANSVYIYQLTDDGGINKLPDYKGIPSDQNFLNQFLLEGNHLFDQLLEIEEEL